MKRLGEHEHAKAMDRAIGALCHAMMPFQAWLTGCVEKYRRVDREPKTLTDGTEVWAIDLGRAVDDYLQTPVGVATQGDVLAAAYALLHAQAGQDAVYREGL